MRLVDGQVMDYVKGTGPYVDERFGQPNLLTGQTADVTVEPSVQPALAATSVGTFAEPEDGLGPVGVAINNVIDSHARAVSQWQVNNVPQQPIQPQIQTTQNSVPWTPYAPVAMPNDMIALRARIQARIDTFESLDDKTPEMNATIKALKWVVDDIAKNTVTFTNFDRTIP